MPSHRPGPGLVISSVVVMALLWPDGAAAQPYAGPPGASPGPERGEVELLPAELDAPDQREKTPGLLLLEQTVPVQELRLGGGSIIIELDGSTRITPLYGIFSLRFGLSDRFSLEARRALESTFERRAEWRAQYREAAMSFALADLPNYLDRIWHHPGWSLRTKKNIFFALWDECAERGPGDTVSGARQARFIIESYIRWRLPEGSAQAFDAGDLRRLNRLRASHQLFAPYQRSLLLPGKTVALALTF